AFLASALLLPLFFLHLPPTPAIPPLPLHDALPIYREGLVRSHDFARPAILWRRWPQTPPRSPACWRRWRPGTRRRWIGSPRSSRSEEHTSELQSLTNIVCRLLLEKKKQYRDQPCAS